MKIQEPLLEIDDIQGHLLTGFGRAFEMLLGVKFAPEDVAEAKRILKRIAADITSGRTTFAAKTQRRLAALAGGPLPATARLSVSMAISRAGIAKFGGNSGVIADPIFQMGAARSAAAIGDVVDADGFPVNWRFGATAECEPDVLLIIASADESEVLAATERYLTMLGKCCTVVLRECGRRIARDAEHFGFVDGVSQPAVRGLVDTETYLSPRAYPAAHPQARMWARPGQRLTWPGQFIFGYPGLDPDAQQQPGSIVGENEPFLKNGSLLVLRRLSQEVGLFWRAMDDLAAQLSQATGATWSSEQAAARCMGRWRDGTPVSLSPDKPDKEISENFYRLNGFGFVTPVAAAVLTDGNGDHAFPGAEADPTGKSCPFFGHIRKVNPRDQSHDFGGAGSTLRSQMLRRGVPFGPDWKGVEDGADRGLMFMSYQTSIQHGFYRLMNEWVGDGTRPIPGGIDPIIGPAPEEGRRLHMIAAGKTVVVSLRGSFVRATGAGYFFTPGIRALNGVLT